MNDPSGLYSSLAPSAPFVVIGRRAFLTRCGIAGATLLVAALSGCGIGREMQLGAPTPVGFFADGTDFAD